MTERATETRRRRARGPRDMVEQKKRRREGTDTEPALVKALRQENEELREENESAPGLARRTRAEAEREARGREPGSARGRQRGQASDGGVGNHREGSSMRTTCAPLLWCPSNCERRRCWRAGSS